MGSLACPETCVGERIIRARRDPAMFDPRVLRNLLELEERYLVTNRYFDCVQFDVQPYMRKMVATWMMQVKETQPLTTEKLVIYTDNSVRQEELLEFELLLLMQLKWDVLSVTPIDFVDQLLYYLDLDCDTSATAKEYANAFIHQCCTDHNFSVYTPSTIASGSVAAAVFEVTATTAPSTRQLLLNKLQEITGVESDILRECLKQVEAAVSCNRHQVAGKNNEHSGGSDDCGSAPVQGDQGSSQPDRVGCRQVHNTPTDVDMVF